VGESDCAASPSDEQIHTDVEELRELLCLFLADWPLSGNDLRYPALGTDHGPKILRGKPTLTKEKRDYLVRFGLLPRRN
jgi:hypothetical protein